jgi:hypothetical protein
MNKPTKLLLLVHKVNSGFCIIKSWFLAGWLFETHWGVITVCYKPPNAQGTCLATVMRKSTYSSWRLVLGVQAKACRP